VVTCNGVDKWFSICCFKRVRGPRGEKIPERGRGWGNFSPVEGDGDGDGDFLPRGDGYGKLTPDGEFPIAISRRTHTIIQ
jgi:hypothetical protein